MRPAAQRARNVRQTDPHLLVDASVGFDSLPQQIESKLLKRGFAVRPLPPTRRTGGQRGACRRPLSPLAWSRWATLTDYPSSHAQFNVIVVGEQMTHLSAARLQRVGTCRGRMSVPRAGRVGGTRGFSIRVESLLERTRARRARGPRELDDRALAMAETDLLLLDQAKRDSASPPSSTRSLPHTSSTPRDASSRMSPSGRRRRFRQSRTVRLGFVFVVQEPRCSLPQRSPRSTRSPCKPLGDTDKNATLRSCSGKQRPPAPQHCRHAGLRRPRQQRELVSPASIR